MTEHFEVVVVGAGISGIGAGYYLKERCPQRSFVILEGREAIGGTWDLFRYPGIRSDSDMYTFGYGFRPWGDTRAIAPRDAILSYLEETVDEYGIDAHIRLKNRVQRARWSSEDATWTVHVDADGEARTITCNFLFMCAGYYDYDAGYTPEFAGMDRFEGQIVHPQKWTEDVTHEGKRVVVIGSGATAITLVPELAKTAEHVTMLQRSPSYVVALPERDPVAKRLDGRLPPYVTHQVARWKNVLVGQFFYRMCKRFPGPMKRLFVNGVKKELGEDFDVEKHFTPEYDPWDQRMCFAPDGDFFEPIRDGRVSVVTDHVEAFTDKGIMLRSGEELEADLIVTATGLNLRFAGGIGLEVDGAPVEVSDCMTYKAMMLSDVPNMALAFGYTNASWTLKVDVTCEYVCRLLNYMDARGYRRCVAQQRSAEVSEEPFVDFTSGYFLRAASVLPKQGSKPPWKLQMNYLRDMITLKFSDLEDGVMEFA